MFTTNATSGAVALKGDYSWFVTLSNSPADQSLPQSQWTHYMVSVVVCHKRNFPPPGVTPIPAFERAVPVQLFWDVPQTSPPTTPPSNPAGAVAYGGGSVQLGSPINDDPTNTTIGITVKENDWVALCSTSTGLCAWYRVVAIGNTTDASGNAFNCLTLSGPDWVLTGAGNDYVVALGKSVVGVYTVPIELDQDPAWR